MNKLQMLLKKMQDVDWVTRPSEDQQGDVQVGPQTDIVKPRETQPPPGMPGMPGMPTPPSPNAPVKPQALDSLTNQAMAENPEQPMTPAPEQKPYGAKMQHLATMGKMQNKKYPELKPQKTLAGGDDYGLGIL